MDNYLMLREVLDLYSDTAKTQTRFYDKYLRQQDQFQAQYLRLVEEQNKILERIAKTLTRL